MGCDITKESVTKEIEALMVDKIGNAEFTPETAAEFQKEINEGLFEGQFGKVLTFTNNFSKVSQNPVIASEIVTHSEIQRELGGSVARGSDSSIVLANLRKKIKLYNNKLAGYHYEVRLAAKDEMTPKDFKGKNPNYRKFIFTKRPVNSVKAQIRTSEGGDSRLLRTFKVNISNSMLEKLAALGTFKNNTAKLTRYNRVEDKYVFIDDSKFETEEEVYDYAKDFFESNKDIDWNKVSENALELQRITDLNKPINSRRNTPIKEGVSELFESNLELSEIGTQEQYSQYLDTIFPDSKVKDIVYHFSVSKIKDIFNKGLGILQEIYFTNDPEGKNIYYPSDGKPKDKTGRTEVILNIKKPRYGEQEKIFKTLKDREIYFNNLKILNELNKKVDDLYGQEASKEEIKAAIDELNNFTESPYEYTSEFRSAEKFKTKPENTDGLVLHKPITGLYTDESFYVVFEPEQIHILSSKADIQGFKDFMSFENSEFSKYGTYQQFRDFVTSKSSIEIENRLIETGKIDRVC